MLVPKNRQFIDKKKYTRILPSNYCVGKNDVEHYQFVAERKKNINKIYHTKNIQAFYNSRFGHTQTTSFSCLLIRVLQIIRPHHGLNR